MYKHLTILLLIFLYGCAAPVARNDASVSFGNERHDFGKIAFRKEAVYSFEFTNPGKTMLMIYDVKTSCGCTVPEWPKEPVRPGKKGKITIKYDAAFPGVFHKTIEVVYNGPGSPFKLGIKGEVEYPEENQK